MENFQKSIFGNTELKLYADIYKDAMKVSWFLLQYVSGEIVYQMEGMCDTSPSIPANTWINAKEASKIGTLTKSQNKLQLHN